MQIKRHHTKVIKIGSIRIGGENPIAIQSMLKLPTKDVEGAIHQIKRLEKAGCEIIRVAVKDTADALAISRIKKSIKIPIVADIHFHWKLALLAIENGADKIRLNPGNIFRLKEIREIVAAAKCAKIPIRVGVNSGSLPKKTALRASHTKENVRIMLEGALRYMRILEKLKFYDIVVSLKASNILDTIWAYRNISKLCPYPLHLGVTATGLPRQGIVKSSIAIGALLLEGIGDTIRVSLTQEPEAEIKTAQDILESLGLRTFGPQIISCPTCGRCEVDLMKIVKECERKILSIGYVDWNKPPKVAIMGCVVNGPGEAKEADIGIAFGREEGILFKKGKPMRKISSINCVDILLEELRRMRG